MSIKIILKAYRILYDINKMDIRKNNYLFRYDF